MGRALAALAALLVVVTDARPVADPERPFARVRASDDARYSDAAAPLVMMFPSAQLGGRLWARHADGAWARGEGRWRDANVAMAKYARVHRAVLEAEAEADATTAAAAGEGGSRRREPRFVVWRGRHLAGCPFPRRLRAAASALALALVTDRAFLVDDPILERLLDLDASGSFPIDVRVPRRAVLDDESTALSLSTSKTTTNERGNGETQAPDARDDPSDDGGRARAVSLPCGGVAGMRASASRVAVFLADEAVDWTDAIVDDRNALAVLRESGLGENAADVAGTFVSFLLRPRRVTRGSGSPASSPEGAGEVAGSTPRRVVGVHALEDALEYRSDRTEDEEDSGDAEVVGSIPTAAEDPAGELRAWTESCVAALASPRERRDGLDGARKKEKKRNRLASLFGVAGRERVVRRRDVVEGSNPVRGDVDVDVHVAFEDASFSARGAGTVRAWARRVLEKKKKSRADVDVHVAPDRIRTFDDVEAAANDASLADLVALTAGSDALVVTGPGSDLGGVVSAVWRAVTGADAFAPGASCDDGDGASRLSFGGSSFGAERAAALAMATGRGVVAPARRASRGGEGEC